MATAGLCAGTKELDIMLVAMKKETRVLKQQKKVFQAGLRHFVLWHYWFP